MSIFLSKLNNHLWTNRKYIFRKKKFKTKSLFLKSRLCIWKIKIFLLTFVSVLVLNIIQITWQIFFFLSIFFYLYHFFFFFWFFQHENIVRLLGHIVFIHIYDGHIYENRISQALIFQHYLVCVWLFSNHRVFKNTIISL